jgi:hypothetical protein
MVYLAVEEYRARLEKADVVFDGTLWLREGQEWEVETGTGERLSASVEEDADASPYSLFERVVETLAANDTRILCCGTCAHFRRSPAQDGKGWIGYCAYRGSDETAPPYPGGVALLAPDCHAYAYQGLDQPLADGVALYHTGQGSDPEATKVLPAAVKDEDKGLFAKLRGLLGLSKEGQEMVRAGVVERPGGQPCPVCGTRMTNRASVANADARGEERVLSVWRCPHCNGNYLDDWFEAYVGSRAHDAERLYVVPPVEADAAAAIVVHCPRPDVKGCTCIANQHFDRWGDELEKRGRRIKSRESVVSL